MIHLDDIRPYLFDPAMHNAVLTGQLMTPHVLKRYPCMMTCPKSFKKWIDHIFSMPVVSDNRFLGMISKATLLDQYRKELMVQTGRL
jgi:CIC family chloride channel protein